MGKARVAPLRTVTIPRLELTAALVSVKVCSILKRELDLDNATNIFWTDSKVALGYIANDSRRFHVFVANRVQQIRDQTEVHQWKYVPTNENPADHGSRGLTPREMLNSNWTTGPQFLWNDEAKPLTESVEIDTSLDNDPEVRKTKVFATVSKDTDILTRPDISQLCIKYSCWNRLKTAVAVWLRVKTILKSRVSKAPGVTPVNSSWTTEELHNAGIEVIKMVQEREFKEEMDVLRSFKNENPDGVNRRKLKKALKATSSLFRLDPYLDDNGVIRAGGRLRQSTLPTEIKHPIILPRKHHVSELIIRHCHEQVHHQGRGMTVNAIRSLGFWILGCSSAVTRFIRKCVTCRKLRYNVQEQKMADLPSDRLELAPPFTFCAVDYFGPWIIKEGRKEVKRYGVLFTCMASRAIHIETANALTTDSFINALRRFIAIRGPIQQIRSDQGTNFVGADRELTEALNCMDEDKVQRFLLAENCNYVKFKMNVPSASHMGGVWERQIRSVRNVLRTLMNQAGSQLDDESLRTFMMEAMAVVNSRPLTTQDLNDPTSPEPLTPNHLLMMKSNVVLPPPGEFMKEDLYSRKRWRRVQHLVNECWTRWRKEFLNNLQQRSKWNRQRRNLQVGDVVIIKEDNTPRNLWPLARVVSTL